MRSFVRILIVPSLLMFAGCASDDRDPAAATEPEPPTGDAEPSPQGPAEDDDLPFVCDFLAAIDEETEIAPSVFPSATMVYGRVVAPQRTLDADLPCPGLPDVEVCLYNTDVCTRSDADGFYMLEGLPEGEKEITFVKAGYRAVLRQVVGNWSRMYGPPMDPVALLAPIGGVEFDPDRGSMAAYAIGVPSSTMQAAETMFLGDIEIRIEPSSGDGPFYSRGNAEPGRRWDPEPALSATSEGGIAWFFNLEPGDYALEFRRDGEPLSGCMPLPHGGLGADDQGRLKVRIRDFLHLGMASVYCNVP
jgi:hypothetical protein